MNKLQFDGSVATITALNNHLAHHSYINGASMSSDDMMVFNQIMKTLIINKHHHVIRWFAHIAQLTPTIKQSLLNDEKGNNNDDSVDNKATEATEINFDDLLSSNDDPQVSSVVAGIQAKNNKKTPSKPARVAKSNVIIDISPADSNTDMSELEESVRSIAKDGLVWAASELEPMVFNLVKLRIIAIVEDDKVSVDDLLEAIEELPLVQSTSIHAFNTA